MLETSCQRQILKGCLERQPRVWEDFLDEYLPIFFHVVCKVESQIGFNEPQISNVREECLAAVITGFLENPSTSLRDFRGESNFDSYLIVSARSSAIKFFQSILGRKTTYSFHQDQIYSFTFDDGKCIGEVNLMLENLQPTERETARLYYLEGYSLSDVAKKLKISVDEVGSHLSRARKKIQLTRLQ